VALRGLLASALASPSSESVRGTTELAEALAELPDAPASLHALASELAACETAELAAAHERLFTGDVRLPPYEGSYELDPFRQARQMADVAGFYRAFGADSHGLESERPDHAGTELEFLAYLGLRRLEAETSGDGETAMRCAEIEDDFLTTHAGRWLPVFFGRLAEEAEHPVHRALGVVGHDAVVAELTGRGLAVEPVPADRRPRTAVEEDELTCAEGDDPAAPLVPDRPT
jgi:TorA maturation chaperone TorD